MDESLKKQSDEILSGAPTIELAPAVTPEPLAIPEKEYDPSQSITATTEQRKDVVTQRTGTSASKSSTLNPTAKTPYSGGSAIPGQEISARLRSSDGSEGNPFYLEPLNRFIPVEPYKINLPSLQKEFTVDTTDPEKIGYLLATLYQGVPKSNFVGYQYVGPEIEETMWDRSTWAKTMETLWPAVKKEFKSILGSVAKGFGNVISTFESIPDKAQAILESPEALEEFPALGKLTLSEIVLANSKKDLELKDLAGKSVEDLIDETQTPNAVLKALEKEIDADLAVKVISGVAQKPDKYWGNTYWNEAEQYIRRGIKELEAVTKDNQLVNPTLGAEVAMAIPQSMAAMAPTLAFGTIIGPAMRYFSYRESIAHSLMDKGMTYDEAIKDAATGALLSSAIEAATARAGGLLANQFIKDYAAHTLAQAAKKGVISYAAHVPFEVVGETYQEKVEGYFARDLGVETFTEFTRQDLITALSAAFADMPEFATTTVKSYVEGREKLQTIAERKKYDEQFVGTLAKLIQHGDAYRKVFVGLGFSEIEADNMVMQIQANGKESFEQFLMDALAGQLDRLMSGEMQETVNGVAQTLAPASKDPMVFAKEEYAKLDQRIDEALNEIQAGDVTESDRNIVKALYRIAATEWAYRTGNMVSEFDLPTFRTKVFTTNTSAESDVKFVKSTGERISHQINLSDSISRDVDVAVSKDFLNFSSLKPIALTTKSALTHEIIHDVLDTFARDNGIDAQAFREFINIMNEFGLQKAFDKKSTDGKLNKLGSESAIVYANKNPRGIRKDIKKGTKYGNYNDPREFSEYAAQATGFLGKDTAKMLGMGTSKSWAFLSKLNRILSAMNDVTPLSKGLQTWLDDFQKFVKDNSKQIVDLVNEKGSRNLKAALQALLDGNDNAINWKGITWNDLKELLALTEQPMDSQALALTKQILDGFTKDEISSLTERLWNSEWAVDEKGEVVPNGPGETNQANTETDVDEIELDELLDPFENIETTKRSLKSDEYKTIVSKDGKEFVFDNSLEGIGGTGITRDSHEGYDTIIINMPIDDYLSSASPLNEKIKDSQSKFFDESIEQGKSFAMPVLSVDIDGDSKTMTVYGHEGRNRAWALKRAGFETIPVIIKSPDLKPVRDGVVSELSETIKRDPKGVTILSQEAGEPVHTISSENLLNQNDIEQVSRFSLAGNDYMQNNFIRALADKEQEAKQPKSGFEKQLEKKVDGRTLEEDLDQMIDLVKNTKRQRGIATWLSERRGILGPLFSLGGFKALKMFDFAGKHRVFRDMYNGRMGDFRNKVISELFGGSSLDYSQFITDFMARNITTTVMDPVTHQKKEIKVSKNIIAQAMLSHAQEKSNGAVRTRATFLDYDNLIKNMDEKDIAFMNMMRANLKEVSTKSFKQQKGESVGRILENYFPMVSWKAVSEDSPASTLSFFSRKDTTSPIGVIGAIEVFGRYHGRLAGSDSEYFHTIKRMGEILDFAKYASKDGLMEGKAQQLATKSRELRELVVRQIGTSGLSKIEEFLDYVKSGSATRDTSKGIFGKLARTISPALLGGKLKNFFTNVTQAAYWLGAPTKDAPTYWAEVAGVLSSDVRKTYEEFMEIGKSRTGTGFFKLRKENAALTEFVAKSTGPGEESLMKDFATFLQSKNLTRLADLAEVVSWFANRATNIVMSPSIAGDIVGNMFFSVAYRRALIKENLNKGMSSEAAILDADNRVIDFVLTRESSTNQAVKPMEILDWNRNWAILGSMGQFTGETTASWGAVGQAYQGYKMGEIDQKTAIKEIVSILTGHMAYRAIQAGLFGAAFSAAIGELDDEEKEFVFENFGDQMAQEIIEGIAGPWSSIAHSAIMGLVNDRTYGLSIPVLSEGQELAKSLESLTRGTLTEEEIKTNDLVRAIGSSASFVGAFPALENILNSIRGAYLAAFGDTAEERTKGRYMASGRTERFAEKAAGIKRSSNKNVDKKSAIK